MSRPPKAREGTEASLAGRRISAGLAPFRREISTRASTADLWAALETSVSEPEGFRRLERLHHTPLDRQARLRARAFLNQARQYYLATEALAPAAKPLTGYYFALNLTKVLLTVTDPPSTEGVEMFHGLGQAFTPGTRYSFQREKFKIKQAGAFRLLAENTGMRHCWANNYELGLSELLPYLADAYELYADSSDSPPKLVPLLSVRAMFGAQRTAWLRVEVDRDMLVQRGLGPVRLLKVARPFGDRFRLVDTETTSFSYESTQVFTYGQKRSEVLTSLTQLYDETLIASDRSYTGPRQFVVLSARPRLLSHEAVTFSVLHHLSNVVRYRPADAERLLKAKNAWLLANWVDKACESFLLNLATRVTGQDHVLT